MSNKMSYQDVIKSHDKRMYITSEANDFEKQS